MTEEESLYISIGEKIKGAEQAHFLGEPCFNLKKKPFICFFKKEMCFKLTGDCHKDALSLKGAKLFDPKGDGKPKKEWVQVPHLYKDRWAKYAKQAATYVSEY